VNSKSFHLKTILDKDELLRALDRAAAVNGFVRELRGYPDRGVERALIRTASNFRHLTGISPRSLRRWVSAVLRDGLSGAHERKLGRVGARARVLHKILK
jgi:hypothetical protein